MVQDFFLVDFLPVLSKLRDGIGPTPPRRLRPGATQQQPATTATDPAASLDGHAGHGSSGHATDCQPHDHIRTRRRRRPQPLTGDRLADAISRYQQGETLKQIATDLGVSRTFLRTHFTHAGVQVRQHAMTEDEVRQAAYLYGSGQSLATIGQRIGYSPTTVNKALVAAGVPMRDRHGREQ